MSATWKAGMKIVSIVAFLALGLSAADAKMTITDYKAPYREFHAQQKKAAKPGRIMDYIRIPSTQWERSHWMENWKRPPGDYRDSWEKGYSAYFPA